MSRRNKMQMFFIILILFFTLVLLFFLIKDFFLDIVRFQKDNDITGLNEFIKSKGLIAPVLIVVAEALQMISVYISIGFIQLATALSYAWYYALLICLVGVLLGASLIYALVHMLKFEVTIFKNNYKKIKIIEEKNKQMRMYLLFITPLVPFGFVCYYGAKHKLGFGKYIFTCLTGAVINMLGAIAMAHIIKHSIINNIPWWGILIISIVFILLLFYGFAYVFKRAKKYSGKGTPDSRVYNALFRIFKACAKNRPIYDVSQTFDFEGSFIILSNHPSFYDVYYVCETIDPIRPAFILNRFYFRNKYFKKILGRMGTIPKKIFTPDIDTIKKSMKTIRKGYPIYMCPEGRLSADGTNYKISIETAKFIKQNKVPVVIINIQGAYLAKPKWRKKQIKADVRTNVYTIISKEDVDVKSLQEITDIINDGISFNDFEYAKENNLKYKNRHKAEGLENILYYCPKCHKEHVLSTKGNVIKCNSCGFKLEITENYWFEENELNIGNIHEWYEIIKKYERENLKNGIDLKCEVTVKKYNLLDESLNEEGKGVCYLTNNEFTFEGDLKVGKFTHTMNNLAGLAFSAGEEFECYYDNELYYFYPNENRSLCAKWALLVDEIHNEGDL